MFLSRWTGNRFGFIRWSRGRVDLSAPALEKVRWEVEQIDSNQRAVLLVMLQDVSRAYTQQEEAGLYYLVEGRWPDGDDTASGARGCAVHEGFAAARGFSVGDTVEMAARDVNRANQSVGYLYGENALTQTEPKIYEIVGIYSDYAQIEDTYHWNLVFVPRSILPDSPEIGGTYLAAGVCSFELTGPDMRQAFQEEMEQTLAELGFRAVFPATNGENFDRTERSMRSSALGNLMLYTMTLLGTLGLVLFLYLTSRKKDFAIARALGPPKGVCVRQLLTPFLLLSAAGVAAGGALGWRHALRQAVRHAAGAGGIWRGFRRRRAVAVVAGRAVCGDRAAFGRCGTHGGGLPYKTAGAGAAWRRDKKRENRLCRNGRARRWFRRPRSSKAFPRPRPYPVPRRLAGSSRRCAPARRENGSTGR